MLQIINHVSSSMHEFLWELPWEANVARPFFSWFESGSDGLRAGDGALVFVFAETQTVAVARTGLFVTDDVLDLFLHG